MQTRRRFTTTVLSGATLALTLMAGPLAGIGWSADNTRVALIMTGPITDGGWAQLAYEGLVELGEKPGFDVAYAENVSQANIPRSSKAMRMTVTI